MKAVEDKVQEIFFPQLGDERGELIVIEGGASIPFDIRRVFYICGTQPGVVRGQHANRKSRFVLVNVAGESKVKIKDGKGGERIFVLNKPHQGLYIPAMVWKEMYDFSKDSVLLVLSDEHYDAEEYIRNYIAYERIMNRKDIE